MRFLFLDESGMIEDGRLFALGGIAVRDTDWAALRDLWQGTLRAAGYALHREVKWHGIRGPSHHSIGLQCAGLIVAATAAAERGGGDARRYLAKLLPRFAHHPATGELEGVGLKRFPEAVPRPHGKGRLFGLEGMTPSADGGGSEA